MSLLFTYENCSLISHEHYINEVYKNCSIGDDIVNYKIRSDLFDLNVPYRQKTNDEVRSKKRHRKIVKKMDDAVMTEHQDEYALIERLKKRTKQFIEMCHEKHLMASFPIDRSKPTNDRLKRFLDEWRSIEHPTSQNSFHGGNNAINPVIVKQNDTSYFIPGDCRFFKTNIKELQDVDLANSYDLIILDPPWWNKYVRRSRKFSTDIGYEMLKNEDIADIPIERLIQVDRTLVGIWCTNAPSMIEAVKQLFLPKWKLKLLATWFWIKVTKYGETICEFDLPMKKQPFERIFVACHVDSTHEFNIPDEKLLFSVPSAIHSHKPPLQDLLTPYLNQCDSKPMSLEFFARYLLPNCTSIGLEVLQLQHLQLFQEDQRKNDEK